MPDLNNLGKHTHTNTHLQHKFLLPLLYSSQLILPFLSAIIIFIPCIPINILVFLPPAPETCENGSYPSAEKVSVPNSLGRLWYMNEE